MKGRQSKNDNAVRNNECRRLVNGQIGHARSLVWAGLVAGMTFPVTLLISQELDLSKLPPTADRPIDYGADIQPILEAACWECHGDEKPKSGLNLRHRATALEGGDYGVAIVVGDSAKSPMIHLAAHLEEDFEMPPIGKGDPLTGEQIGLLRAWIDQGLVWPESQPGGLVPEPIPAPSPESSPSAIDLSSLPPAAVGEIDFDRDILPIFEASCFRCHGDERPKGRFNLRHQQTALKGGANGVDIIPGDSVNSPLIHFVARLEEDFEMPPEGKGDPLTGEQIGLLRAWIDQGAKWSAIDENYFQLTVSPTLGFVSVSGDERQFREHHWLDDGVMGGASEFKLQDRLEDGTRITAEGRALFGNDDYEFKLTLEKPELGFIRAGYDQYRRYYDDTGGYYEPFGVPPISLGRDLYLDTGRAWIDFGLTLPDFPQLTVGYEYQYRDGTKSMLQWGSVYDLTPFVDRGIYPAVKDIDEDTHIIKVDATHEWRGYVFENSFRGEFYDLSTQRRNADSTTLGGSVPDSFTIADDDYDHFQGANTFRVEKQLKKWWLLTGGYLYSHLDGDAGVRLETFLPDSSSFLGDYSREIVLDRDSHVFNANTLLGPWQDLNFFAGVQSEWTRQDGEGDVYVFGAPTGLGSNLDTFVIEENFGARYTKIPFTVLYADTRFQQREIDQREGQFIDDGFDDSSDFMRDTDATGDLKEYRGGFTVSPWTFASLSARYRHQSRKNDFDHRLDTDRGSFVPPGNGYSAFIRDQDTDTDDFEVKLTGKPVSWLKSSLKYRLTASDYHTKTDGVEVAGAAFPPARVLAGNYDAHTYSVDNTFTPWRRLFLTSSLSYTDIRLRSGVNNGTSVVPYDGDIYSVLSNANYILNDTTDLIATYSYSTADFSQSNEAFALPLGNEYDQHGIVTGIVKRFKRNLSVKLQYGFFKFDEPSSGHDNDYDAHAVFLTMTKVFR